MGDPTPRNELGNARLLRELLARVRRLEQATPLQTAFNDASAAQTTATGAQTTATAAQGVAQGASYDASVAQQQATAAQTTAQQASTDAASASSAASSASQQAQQAQQAVAAKTKTTWSSSVPDNAANPGTADGDTWYVTNGTGGNATAQYRWSASSNSWTLTPIDGTALRNVIADTVKAGAIDGQTITGAVFKSSASGQRVEILNTLLQFYGSDNTYGGYISAVPDGTSSGQSLLQLAQSNSASAGRIIIQSPQSMGCTYRRIGGARSTLTATANIEVRQGLKTSGPLAGSSFWLAGGARFVEEIPDPNNILRGRVRGLFRELYYRDDSGDFYEVPVLDRVPNDSWVPNRHRLTAHELWARNVDSSSKKVVSNDDGSVTVVADNFRGPDGASLLPVAGSPINPRSGWTVAATRMWVEAGYAYIQFAANKSSVLAAGASEAVCDVPAAFIPAAGQYLVPGACYGSTSPAPGLLQISASGTITVFNFGGNHNSFSGIFAHPV